MPSPDVRKYIDLTLYDQDSQVIFQNALSYARVALPEFRPREGSVETVVMQAVAVEVAQLARAINRLPGGIVQILLQLYGIYRNEASLPTAVLRINAVDSSDYILPAGIRVFYQPTDGDPLVMVSDEQVSVTHSKNVSGIDIVSGTATVTTSFRHGFNDLQTITIAGIASPNDAINGSYTISVDDEYSFTFATAESDVSLSFAGTVSATPPASHPSTGFVSATGTVATENFNGLSAGTAMDILSSLPRVSSISLAEKVSNGELAESDTDYFTRAASQFARMSTTLATSNSYAQWAISNQEFPYIYRAKAVDGYEYNLSTPADGVITLVVAPIDASVDNTLSGKGVASVLSDPSSADWGQKDEIRLAAQEISHAAINVSVVDPHLVTVAVSCTMKPRPGVSGATMATAASSALAEFLSPNTWEWDTVIRKNELIGVLSGIVSDTNERLVDYVSSISLSVTAVDPQEFRSANVVASSSYAGTTLTVNASTSHGLNSLETNYVALKIGTAWEVFESTYVDADTFSVQRATTASPTEWFLVASVDSNGDMTIDDLAPLVVSGDHEVTAI